MEPITLLIFLTGSFIVSSTGYATAIFINTYYGNEFIRGVQAPAHRRTNHTFITNPYIYG